MGANLLIASIGLKGDDRTIDDAWARSAFARAKQAIEAIDEAKLAELDAENNGVFDDLPNCKEALLRDLTEIEAAVFGEHRHAATILGGGGVILLLAGGFSWGDPPSELFESMSRLLDAGVLPDARWPGPHSPANPVPSP